MAHKLLHRPSRDLLLRIGQILADDSFERGKSVSGKRLERFRYAVVAAGQQKDLPVRPDLGRKVAVPTVHGHKQRVIPGNPDPA